jgi:DNA-binding transcriptional regulator YhcF (GntR family)
MNALQEDMVPYLMGIGGVEFRLTNRQLHYRTVMEKFFKENDQLPPMAMLAELAGTSSNAAYEMLHKLEQRGVIERNTVGKFKRGRNW